MLFQEMIIEKCLAFQIKLNSSCGRLLPPLALDDWTWSVKDVDHTQHWALCEEQVLCKGPMTSSQHRASIEWNAEKTCWSLPKYRSTDLPLSLLMGIKNPPDPSCCLAQSFYGWRDNALFWLIFTFFAAVLCLQTGIRLLKCLRMESVDCLGFHLLLFSKY